MPLEYARILCLFLNGRSVLVHEHAVVKWGTASIPPPLHGMASHAPSYPLVPIHLHTLTKVHDWVLIASTFNLVELHGRCPIILLSSFIFAASNSVR